MRELPLILALDIAGTPHKWLTYQQVAYYYAKDLVAWSLNGAGDYTLWGGDSRMTGERSFMDVSSIIAIRSNDMAKHASKLRRVPRLSNKILFRRDRHLCAYCGDPFSASKLTRDHVTPTAHGGKNKWSNLVTACKSCNHRKADRTPEQAHMSLLYVPYVPDRAEHLILLNRKILTDQMDFLLAQVKNKHSRLLK